MRSSRRRVTMMCRNPSLVALLVITATVVIYFNFGWGDRHRNTAYLDQTAESSLNVSLKSLLVVSIEMAKGGGQEVKRIREQADIGEKSKGKTQEGANNPVTDGDMLSHRQMYYGLLKAFPNIRVISEESDPEEIDMNTIKEAPQNDEEVDSVVPREEDQEVPAKDVDVWIDPLDATQEYTESLLQYVTTMVCVAVKGRPTIGVIHKPFEGVTAWAWVGPNYVSRAVQKELDELKAKLGDDDVHKDKDLSKTRIIVSRSHTGSVRYIAKKAFGETADVEGAGGAGYKAWEVAKGNKDVYIHSTLIKKWDICGGAALLNALGGRLTDLQGYDVDFSSHPLEVKNEGGVLASMHDHKAYVKLLKDVKE